MIRTTSVVTSSVESQMNLVDTSPPPGCAGENFFSSCAGEGSRSCGSGAAQSGGSGGPSGCETACRAAAGPAQAAFRLCSAAGQAGRASLLSSKNHNYY